MENQPENQSKHKLLSWGAVATAGALALLTLMPELFDLYSESEQKEEPRTDVTKPSLAVSAHEPLRISSRVRSCSGSSAQPAARRNGYGVMVKRLRRR